MRIEEKIDKYLMDEKASRKEAAEKLVKTIKSVKSEKHIDTVVNMIQNYFKMYGESKFIDDIKMIFSLATGNLKVQPERYKLYDLLIDRIERMSHEGKMSKSAADKIIEEIEDFMFE